MKFWRTCLGLLALCCGLGAAPSRAAVISYTLADPALAAPGGYFDPATAEGLGRFMALMDVKLYLEGVIPNPGSVTIELSTFSSPGAATLASGGQFFSTLSPTASGIVYGDTQAELLFGTDVTGANGFLTINTAKPFYLGPDPLGIGAGMPDLRSVLLHEMTHALGWASFMKPDDGTSALTDFLKHFDPIKYAGLGEVYSLYDSLLIDTMDKPLLLPDGTFNAASLPMGGALITSPMAVLFNGGALVPTAVVPFIDGDLTHLASSVASVMNSTLASGTTERVYSPVDLGVLKDLGYIAAPAAVPEPGSAPLVLAALLLAFLPLRTGRRKI